MQQPWPIINLQTVDSTNSYAHYLLSRNVLKEETVINAYCQESGRGQAENKWESEAGKNLTFTLALFPGYLHVENQFYLLQAVSLAIIDFLESHEIVSKIKWPNDILVSDSKIGGILIENSIMNSSLAYSLIGIGLNVNQKKFSNFTFKAQSMKNLTFIEYNLNELLNQLLICLKKQVDRLREKHFVSIKKDYIEKLYKFGQKSPFSSGGDIFFGKITDVNESGQLVIITDEGKVQGFMFKEVEFIQ